MRATPLTPAHRCIAVMNGACHTCTRHLEHDAYTGQPLIVPHLDYDARGVSFCTDRIPAGQIRPAAVSAGGSEPVCAFPHGV